VSTSVEVAPVGGAAHCAARSAVVANTCTVRFLISFPHVDVIGVFATTFAVNAMSVTPQSLVPVDKVELADVEYGIGRERPIGDRPRVRVD